MKLLEIQHKALRGVVRLKIEKEDETYGHVIFYAYINNKEQISIRPIRIKNNKVSKNTRMLLSRHLQNNKDVTAFIRKENERHLENTPIIHEFPSVIGINVLSIDTKYIRYVRRNGPNVSNIEEITEEEHKIHVIAFFDNKGPVSFVLKYNPSKGYKLQWKDAKEKEKIQNYLYPHVFESWKEQILTRIKEKVYVLLP